MADGRQAISDRLALAQALTEARSTTEIGRALLDYLIRSVPTDALLLALYDPISCLRTCVYSAGPDGEDSVVGLPAMPLGTGPQSQAVLTGQPVIVADLEARLSGEPVVYVGTERDARLTNSSLALPIITRGRTAGVLEVQSYDRNAFDDAHVETAMLAARMAALALESIAQRPAARSRAGTRALQDDIRAIIANEAFRPVFQPVADLSTGSIVGYEALTRFDAGIAPDEILRQASECGLGHELEAAMLRRTFEAALRLPRGPWLSINVSPEMVLTGRPLAALLARAEREVVLEITEQAPIADYALFKHAIRQLPKDVKLAIDDAGAGYASFRHILELRPEYIKLDRAMSEGIDKDVARQALVKALADFGRASGARVVAEGIETTAQLEMLRRLNVPLGQGYLLGVPTPSDSIPTISSRIGVPHRTRAPRLSHAHAGLSAGSLAA